ncbi:hypothetical protein AUL38_00365 [Leucobacter sp. G161]|nr:hypothetical protein AUL38_00365 [Leucobacter sp. G161]
MVTRSVILHCNADLERGMGHLMRALCLAEEATSRGWDVTIAGEFGGRAVEHVAALFPGQEIVELGDGPLQLALSTLLAERSADLLHLDTYDEALDSFRPPSVLTSNMQDGMFGRRPADLHIDANLDAEHRYSAISQSDRVLLGSSVVQVRREMRAIHHEVGERPTRAPRVLVVLGGTDPFNITPQVVLALLKHPRIHLTVICRPEAQPELLRSLGADAHRVKMLSFTNDLPRLADSMDAVISAAGTSVWDFASAGIPMAIVAVTENQLPGYSSCAQHGIGFPLGTPPFTGLEDSIGAFLASVEDPGYLRDSAERGRSAIDGLGAWRVVSAWEALVQGTGEQTPPIRHPQLRARRALASDAGRLFEWRNDSSTRAVSRSHKPIAWDEHVTWMGRVLADEHRQLLIIEHGDEPVATVRWDRLGDSAWEASITIAPSYRGKGLGKSVLATGEHWFANSSPKLLLATVHRSNAASRRLFLGAHYLPHLPADSNGFETLAKWQLPSDHSSS